MTVVGAGNVGTSTAQCLLTKGLGDGVLIDVVDGLAKGKALDLAQSAPIENYRCGICGGTSYEMSANSDVIIITADIARRPGMSRDDLLNTNKAIVADVVRQAAALSPEAVLIVVSNPLDAMCHVAFEASGFPKRRVIGMAGVLDTACYRAFLAEAINVSPADIQAMVLGGHGDTMVPLTRYTTVSGIPVSEFIDDNNALTKIVERTRAGGAEIVSLLKTGSAFYAPAAAAQMAEAIIKNRKTVLPCAAYLEGEYGIGGIFMGVPVKLGGGIEEIIEVQLSDEEKRMLEKSAQAVRELIDIMKGTPTK